jgi:hypothetical protein
MGQKRLGDGTGQGKRPPEKQGLTCDENAKPASSTGKTGNGEGGMGAMMPREGHGNRSAPLRRS